MKKMIFTFFIILFLPTSIFAYSKNVIPGGESIGININSNGLIVVGYYKVNDEYIAKKNVKIGDEIVKVNGKNISSLKDFTESIDYELKNNSIINISVKRHGNIIDTILEIKEEDGVLKTGLYIKDSVVGLGTLTYIDPVTKIYGSLGHEIMLNETNSRVEIKDGNILISKITSIDKSINGRVGSKNASISFNKKIGTIEKNVDSGIYGFYTGKLPKKEAIPIGEFSNIYSGEAYILTVTNKNDIKKYNINIIDKFNSKKNTGKAFSFEITDKELLDKTGGIVQGMSGSPIIQNNKLIGAVTNVVVDKVKMGYGISIIKMLEDGDELNKIGN